MNSGCDSLMTYYKTTVPHCACHHRNKNFATLCIWLSHIHVTNLKVGHVYVTTSDWSLPCKCVLMIIVCWFYHGVRANLLFLNTWQIQSMIKLEKNMMFWLPTRGLQSLPSMLSIPKAGNMDQPSNSCPVIMASEQLNLHLYIWRHTMLLNIWLHQTRIKLRYIE